MKSDKEQFKRQAEFCKFMANAKRLEILYLLKDREVCVEDLADKMELNIPNVSQHLAVMKKKGIVEVRRDGVKMYYKLANQKIMDACSLMKDLMSEQMKIKTNN